MKYRSEIDGLRALAVLPVVLFHAGFELFRGGFVGVDVFFVISGYLITTILINDIENKQFSIINFYERRARRILPALFFVMLVCIPFAWMWMLPERLKDFSLGLVAVNLFVSNVLFWRQDGYFDVASDENPLLHTWSLAVEEQYYLVFPIFLVFAWRFGKTRVFWMIVIMAAISLMLSEWGWRNKATANFFLAPTRAWELFSGSIAAFIVQKQGVQKNNILAILGLVAIIFSIFAYGKNTPFPSLYTLVPVLGVVMIILFADKETLVARLLSAKILVGIGLISYSAYLWHHPIFAFARINIINPPLFLMVSLSLMSLLFAFVSWKYIEQPFRNKKKFSRNYVFGLSLIGILIFSTLGMFGNIRDGFPSKEYIEQMERLNDSRGLSDKFKCMKEFLIGNECATSLEPDILVWGDSFAAHFLPGLLSANPNIKVQQATVADCAPILDYAKYDAYFGASECIRFNDNVYNWLSKSNVRYVVLASIFETLTNNKSLLSRNGSSYNNVADLTYKGIVELVGKIRAMGKIPVIVTPAPANGSDIGKCLISRELKGAALSDCNFSMNKISKDTVTVTKALLSIPEANVVNLTTLICSDGICSAAIGDKFIFRDKFHLSIEGSRFLGSKYDFYNLVTSGN